MGFPDFKCVFMYQGLRRWKGLKKPQLFQEEKGHFKVEILCTRLCNVAEAAYRLGSEGGDRCESCVMLRGEETIEPLKRIIPPNNQVPGCEAINICCNARE